MKTEEKLAQARRNYARNRQSASRRRLSYWRNVITRLMEPYDQSKITIQGVTYFTETFTK